MVSVYSINGEVTLDITPFTSEISKMQGELKKLSEGLKFDKSSLESAREGFQVLADIMHEVTLKASEINKAFANIEGIKTLIENLNQVQQFLKEIGYEVKAIDGNLKKQAMTTEQRAVALGNIGKQIIREGSEIKKNLTYEEEMLATEKLFQSALSEEIASRFKIREEINVANELYMKSLTAEKEMLNFLNEERGIISNLTGAKEKGLAIIEEELALEERKLGIIEEETAMLNEQGAVRQKNAMKGNQLDSMSYLPRRIGSMALTMWGFNEIMDIYDKTMGHINAESQKDYFAKRMNMNAKATQNFTNQLNNMQKEYQKVDMTQVGANALETATKYKVQEKSLGDLTEVMAIYSSEFVKQGRTQEDSILAINDALDGELRRLKEVGIGKEELTATGLWSGDESDKEGMLKALLQIAQERGYDQTAKDITNLSDAITVLEVKLGIDLARAFGVIEPLLRDVLKNFVTILESLEWAISKVTPKITEFAKAIGLIDENGNATKFGNFLESWASWLITFGITAYAVYKIAKPLLGMFGKLKDVGGDIATETGDVATTMNKGGFKENFKSEWGKLGKNLGKMARVFVEFAVALGMAFVLIEEAILIISGIGATYNALKPQFDSGIEFIKEFGLWFALLGGAMIGLSYAIDKISTSAIESITKGATKLAYGMAIAVGLVAEAIALLILPLGAIALLGGTASFLGANLDKGIEVISWIGNALHQIDMPIALFIGGFLAVSLLLGLVQPLTLALAVGIASSLVLVTEAIVMLIPPLTAIALLGGTASMLGEENINQGAEAISMIGRVLQVLSGAIVNLLIVDIGVFGVQLVDWANRFLSGGKDGLTVLVDEILPSLQDFITKFNQLDFSTPVDPSKVQAVSQMAEQIPPLFNAIQKINNALGTTNLFGNITQGIGGSLSGAMGMGLKGKLDQLYNDVRDVMDFANKLGNVSTNATGNASGVTAVANAVAQLQAKLRLMVTTINTASVQVRASARNLGSGLSQGFKEGSAIFSSTVVSVLAKGVTEIQSRYNTFNNGGRTLGQKMTDGFKNHKPTLQSTVAKECQYALRELDNYKDDFYSKGQALGQSLHDGFVSSGGLDFHSPAKITRSIVKELEYSMFPGMELLRVLLQCL